MMDPFAVAHLDQAAAKLRDKLDLLYPVTAALVREPASPWHDGGAMVVVDLLEHRGSYRELYLRLLAWDLTLLGDE